MPESVDWSNGGTPYSPRFGDRYHSSARCGLDQAHGVFLAGCALPAAWAMQAQWRILETGFGLGLNFLVTWAAWRSDAARPRILHFISCEAWPVAASDLLRAAQHWATLAPELQPLAHQLATQFWGLLPGVHRLSFEGGQVLLTLYIGDAQRLLRQQKPEVDAVYLDGFSPARNPDLWSLHTLKAVARCCRRGTHLATWCVARAVCDALTQCGFSVHKVCGVPPKRHNLHATFNPLWQLRAARPALPNVAVSELPCNRRCIVIGAGLAGAATAASLARRGWQVQVLESGSAPAAAASGLPAGVFAPHVSPDDCLLSRLSRAGVRTTLQTLMDVAPQQRGIDWDDCGVLEHAHVRLPWTDGPGLDWSRLASPGECAASHLPDGAPACQHVRGGWLRPQQLVLRLLAQPGVQWQTRCTVARLRCQTSSAGAMLWQALDARDTILAEADIAVICAGAGSAELLQSSCHKAWPLQAIRGQIAWNLHPSGALAPLPFPAQPLNGHGNLVPCVPLGSHLKPEQQGPCLGWVLGSTFERLRTDVPLTPHEAAAGHAANLNKLRGLAPALAGALTPVFDKAHIWAAVRCATPDRLPLVGPVASAAAYGLWVCTGMGARGLSLALLCAELLAARLHGEPLPLSTPLAQALTSERLLAK